MKTLADIQAPAVISRNVLEKDLQKQCVEWARARGYWARKFSSQTQRSVPDYLFSIGREQTPAGFKHRDALRFACEFKKPGTKRGIIRKYDVQVMSTEAQYEEQLAMRKAGWHVFECDDFEEFKRSVMAYEHAHTI